MKISIIERDSRMKAEYLAGSSLRNIAADWKYSIEGVRKILKRNGVKMRRCGGVKGFTKKQG